MSALRLSVRAIAPLRRSVLTTQCASQVIRRSNSTEAVAPVDSKIASIVDQISTLTLLETAALVKELKTRLDIPDISFPAAGAAAAAPAAAAEEAPAEEKPKEKTIFTLKLESFDAKSKPKIIKEVKNLLGLSLVESKKFVESAPKVLKEGVTKEDAEKIKAALEAVGGKIALE